MSDDRVGTSWQRLLKRLLFAASLAGAAGIALADPRRGLMPSNARQSSYGGGWECSRGFHQVGAACVAIDVPAHGYLSAYGSGWDCDRGYLKTDKQCVAIKVPANAYADDSSIGKGWQCN